MHGLQACLFKYITVAAVHRYAHRGESVAKRRGWRPCIKWSWKITENSLNCVFEFLWEPCNSDFTGSIELDQTLRPSDKRVLFVLMLYVPINNFPVMSRHGFLG